MTPEEFKRLRQSWGLSQNDIADLLGVADGRTVRRWEAGTREQPGPVVVLMRILEQHPWLLRDLKEGLLE